MNCGREGGATDKFNRKKRKQVKRAEKRSRSNLKSGSINSLREKLQRSAGPGIRIHLLRSTRPLPDDSHFSGDLILSGRRMRIGMGTEPTVLVQRTLSMSYGTATGPSHEKCWLVMHYNNLCYVIQGSSTFYRPRTPARVQKPGTVLLFWKNESIMLIVRIWTLTQLLTYLDCVLLWPCCAGVNSKEGR